MTEDYLIFGAGYDGEIREFDRGLDFIEVVQNPALISSNSSDQSAPSTDKVRLPVRVYIVHGHRYNVASHELLIDDVLEELIEQ
ncbi:hypothetical protein [Mixta gaviniae]|uniref:Uncharacterized protein n=1 Tax=Mixta gaviniae TaxID=665914 RepID=A0A2L0II79_9GAMM|nr:hypothetical protein [Mixta gaviniae]AUX94278.1 hypothetical protein C2E15_15145 [Mixta gaviniae]